MTAITVPDGLIRPEAVIVGEDGNAFAIMGRASAALRRAGNEDDVISSYRAQATSGDYGHLLAVTMAFVLDIGEDNEDYWDE